MNRSAATVISFSPVRMGEMFAAFATWWLQEMRELSHDVLARIAPRRSFTAEIALAADNGTITLRQGRKISGVVSFERANNALPAELQTFWPSSLSLPAQVRAAVLLPPSSVLVRQLTLPQSIERDLARVIELQLERELPLTRDQVYVDFNVLERNSKNSTIVVALCVARKSEIDEILTVTRAWGFRLASIGFRGASHARSFEFLPSQLRSHRMSLRRSDRFLLLSAAALLILCAGIIGGRWWYERFQVTPVLRETHVAAQRVSKLTADLERQSGPVLEIRERMQQPSIAAMMLKLSAAIPTDSWIQRLEIKRSFDGSANVRLTALSPVATQLLDALRQLPEFEEVNLVSSGPAPSKQPKERVEITAKWRQSAPNERDAGRI